MVNSAGIATYNRFINLATRAINKYGDACTWVQKAETTPDANKPWEAGSGSNVNNSVNILFLRDDLEDRQLYHYLRRSNVISGLVNGIMPVVSFTPKLNDYVIRDGEQFEIAALDYEKPGDRIILYYIEFKI